MHKQQIADRAAVLARLKEFGITHNSGWFRANRLKFYKTAVIPTLVELCEQGICEMSKGGDYHYNTKSFRVRPKELWPD